MKLALMLGVMFVLSIQPMMIISSLIMVVLIYSFYLYWNLSEFWFSYMMVLVLMSGVLVVFTYMMSVLPNESFEVSSLVMLILGFVLMYKGEVYDEFIQNVSMGSMKIWSGISLIVSLFLIIYLLFIMVMVVWLSMMERGAIRIS
uniref:NADH dehydrogenase subunit 6 n=1 Tax=Araneus ventricosus TaxID=182803 RepID=A0A0U1XJ76_ARAVE|nr:NADH dehydrogenase subunit 6 [Araneus ventricosus]AIU45756.1 NADH dehydrogenase subunit 6 [Araneus ventricosus]